MRQCYMKEGKPKTANPVADDHFGERPAR